MAIAIKSPEIRGNTYNVTRHTHGREEKDSWVWTLLENEWIHKFSGQLKSPVSSDGKKKPYEDRVLGRLTLGI